MMFEHKLAGISRHGMDYYENQYKDRVLRNLKAVTSHFANQQIYK